MNELIQSLKNYWLTKEISVAEDALEGTIEGWKAGRGELPAELVNGSELWRPVVEAYFKAHGQDVPESLSRPLVEVETEE